jgi:DNA-binding MarR family transcriptional regulator
MPTQATRRHDTRSHAGLANALRVSITRLSRRQRAQRAGSLSGTELAALGAVDRHGEMTPRELAEHEKVQPPSMTRVIASLEAQGLLRRSPHPRDRRRVRLALTDQGRTLLKAERRRKEAWLAQQLMKLTAQERETLREAAPILEKLSQA